MISKLRNLYKEIRGYKKKKRKNVLTQFLNQVKSLKFEFQQTSMLFVLTKKNYSVFF